MERAPEEKLPWPPRAEDLRRLYLEEHLSAAKIADRYGLKYASPKTAESTILYHLKRSGITRRDKAEHIRRVAEVVVDDWVKRYEAGESLKQIAANEFSPVTVFLHLRKRGIQLRDKVEAQIKAVTKHPRKPFDGDANLKAYLTGIATGDYWVTTHGRAIRVRLGTTHPAMSRLFRELFEHHGPVYEYPKRTPLTEFEWSLDCDLDSSFEFLAKPVPDFMAETYSNEDLFMNFLAGFFDAEGSICYHKKHGHGAFEFSLANINQEIIQAIGRKLSELDFSPSVTQGKQTPERLIRGMTISSTKPMWRLALWRFDDVKRILENLPSKHPEKIAKATIALKLRFRAAPEERDVILSEWQRLKLQIETDVSMYIEKARCTFDDRSTELRTT